MKRTLAISAVSCLLALSLAGCGENARRSDTLNAADDNGGTETKTYMQGGVQNGAVMEESNTGIPKETTIYRNTNSSANAQLRGSGRSVTGTVANPDTKRGGMLGEDEEKDQRAERVRYQLMLDNAYVHDTDGFLFDGENAHHTTW